MEEFPHVSKLFFLSEKQKENYNELTKHQFKALPVFARKFINKYVDVELPELIKISTDRVVLAFKGSIIKLIFRRSYLYKKELYFTNLFYNAKIQTKASDDGCAMVLPKYGEHIQRWENRQDLYRIRRSLIRQIAMFHCSFVVHHDIKPSNVVKLNKYKWQIIDYGLSEFHCPTASQLCGALKKGTKGFNIPLYDFNKMKDHIFWVFMKDWYGVSRTLNVIGMKCNLFILIEKMEKKKIIRRITNLMERYIDILPFYCEKKQSN